MSWIADCSVAMTWCFEDETTPRTEALLDRTGSEPVIVPLHWPLEITNVLRTAVRRGRLTEAQSVKKAAALMSLPVRYDLLTHQVAFTTTYQLAQRHKLTSYDAAYLELAIRLGASLATNDRDLIDAARKAGVQLL
ncbi:MAG: type II toxin-antitoxin system VapC family toxin [Burkholderiales bacterium]|nr:type II toxin-antitoxin system VapC family toxin [Phycisphaerae bacterium]